MITVYLDSNDYSNFATAKPDSETWKIKKQFLEYKKTGKVAFVFSVVGLAEAVPIGSGLNHAASYERLKVIEELCEEHSLKPIFEAVEEEVLGSVNLQPFSPFGEWLPVDFSIRDVAKEVADFAKRGFCKANQIPSNYSFVFDHSYRSQPEYRESVLSGFFEKMCFGEVKQQEFFQRPKEDICLESDLMVLLSEVILDKGVLAETLKTESLMSSQLSSIVRASSQTMAETLTSLLEKQWAEADNRKRVQHWRDAGDLFVLMAFKTISQKLGMGTDVLSDLSNIRKSCPGLSMMARVLANSTRERFEAHKDLVSNQVVDAMHAFYAPYVDIFSADKYTTRIVKDIDSSINIYSTLSGINEELENRIR